MIRPDSPLNPTVSRAPKRPKPPLTGSQQVFMNFPTGFEAAGKFSVYQEMIVGGFASGKALALDTPIPTPHGWTTMGKIQAGDQVFDESGEVCNVTFATEVQYGHKVYEVVFDNGQIVKADAEHLWKTITPANRDRHARQVLKKAGVWGQDHFTTEEIKNSLIYNKIAKSKTHAVNLCPIRGESRELAIHPYVLGCWLGDGCSREAQFTCADPEIIEAIRSFGYKVTQHKNPISYSIWHITPQLHALGVINNKRIPRAYQRASLEQRLWLLKGLMDTDGSANRADGSAEFTSVNISLAKDVWELVNGLGLKAAWMEGRATINGRYISQKYRIRFVAEFPTFHLSRKVRIQRPSVQKRNTKRWIVAVREVPSVPVKCIGVDSPSHLYLITESFIPTHNSWTGMQKGIFLSALFPGNEGMICRLHGSDMTSTITEEFIKQCPQGWIRKIRNRGRSNQIVHFVNGSVVYFSHIRDANQAGTKTRRTGHNLGWFLVEQAEEISRAEWQALNGRLRNPRAKVRFAMGNANPAGTNWIQEDFFPDWTPLDPDNNVYYKTYVRENTIGIHVSSAENLVSRGGFVDDGTYENWILNHPAEWVDRYIHASFADFTGRVYKEYSMSSVHNIAPLAHVPKDWELVGGIDVGGACAWSVLKVYIDRGNNLIVAGEFDKKTDLVRDVAEWIHAQGMGDSRFVIDPENKVAARDLIDFGIVANPAQKSVVANIQRVAGYLHPAKRWVGEGAGRKLVGVAPAWLVEHDPELAARIEEVGCPRLFVYTTCSTWRREHSKVVWDEKRVNQIKKTNTERYDSVDTMGYVVAERPEVRALPKGEDPRVIALARVSPFAAAELREELALIAELKAEKAGGVTARMFDDGEPTAHESVRVTEAYYD